MHQEEYMSAKSESFSLEAKYTEERGRIYLSGIQALVRLPLDQHRADRRRSLHTATFISGYRGSPLGGLDLTLERYRKLLQEHHVVFSSGLNEDLGATAVFGSQMAGLFPKPKYDGVLGMWYGKAPGEVAKRAHAAGVPVVLIAGSKGNGWDTLSELGVTSVVTLVEEGADLQRALNEPEGMLARAAVVACRRHPWK